MGIRKLLIKKMLKAWKKLDDDILAKQSLPEGIIDISDIPYNHDENKEHLLDIYYPENTQKKLPIIIDIHGGGFVYGDKKLNKSFCYYLALQGFIVFNLNYRLALNDTKVLDQIHDVMNAIDWIYNHIASYPADKEHVFMAGDSAGGVLAVMAVLIAHNERLQKLFGTNKTAFHFKAISVICGMMNFDKEEFKYWGLRSVCFDRGYKKKEYYQNMIFDNIPEMNNLPPVFLATSEEDALCYMTLGFEHTLKKYGITYQLECCHKREGQTLGHIFNVQYPEYEESIALNDKMIHFFKTTSGITQ